jgi:hypothetical protein
MHLLAKAPLDSGIVSLQNAVLCVDCESVTSSRCDECPVCGGRALVSLLRMLGGSLLTQRARIANRENVVRFDLGITIALTQIEAKDLNVLLEGIASLIGPRIGGRGASFHITVEPVVDGGAENGLKAA